MKKNKKINKLNNRTLKFKKEKKRLMNK